ncbi:MAG: 4Fe-4S binding protein [Planctomycetota bacterium]
MSIFINKNVCNGCGKLEETLCERICPGDLLFRNAAHKAEIISQADCWTCGACVKACPVQAIDLKLPSQILKSKVSLRAQCKKQHTIWEIRNGNGIKEEYVIPATTGNEAD